MSAWGFSLHWSMNPAVFFILLAVSLVLAKVVWKKWQVAWVIPALVLYFGLDWALPVSWLFKLAFWVAVVIAVLTAVLPGRSRLAQVSAQLMVALIAAVMILSGLNGIGNWFDGSGDRPAANSSTANQPTAIPSATETVTPAPKGLDENKVAKAFAQYTKGKGFKAGEVQVGKVDWTKNPVDHRGGAVGAQVKNQTELTQFLNGSSAQSQAGRQHVLAAVPKSEQARVLNGENYIPVQYLVGVQYGGNTYWQNGKLVRGGKVVAEAGDVFWVFVGQDYKIYWDAAIRSDCRNPGLSHPPVPHRTPVCTSDCSGNICTHNCGGTHVCPPGQSGTWPHCYVPNCHTNGNCPPPNCQVTHTCPPVVHKCPPSMPHGTWPLCKDDPSHDPANNGNAPEGGGHNDTNGPGVQNPPPTFSPNPYTPPPAPSAPPTTSRPDPVTPPATGAPAPSQAPTTCVPPPGKTHC